MKLYIDENLPPNLVGPLAVVYADHQFVSYGEANLRGTDDLSLFAILRQRGFDGIVTRDRAQLGDPLERQALIDSGLRWVGLADKKLRDLEHFVITVATLVAGLRFVFAHAVTGPTSYSLLTVPHEQSQRIRIRAIPPVRTATMRPVMARPPLAPEPRRHTRSAAPPMS